MKMHWGVEVSLHTFLTSELEGGEWSASHLSHFQEAVWAPEPV